MVDVNGDKWPNKESIGNKKQGYIFSDQYRIVIMSAGIVPAYNTTNDAAVEAISRINRFND